MPESRGRGMRLDEVKGPATLDKDILAVYRRAGQGYENVMSQFPQGSLPKGDWLVARMVRAGNSPWHGNRCYVDLMHPGVTEKFLDITLNAYRREIGSEFGRRVPGSFSDEPNINPCGVLPWTDGLPAAFQKRWGYSILDNLPSLMHRVGDWRRVRYNYFQILNDLFIENWSKPYSEYCAAHNMEWTGHYWDHEWPNCTAVPDNMAMYGWPQRPGIDCLMNHYEEQTHAQFGNLRMVKELGSVANQLGCRRTFCEAYGAGGWDLRLEDMKRIGDWLYVLGVNTLDQHLSYITIRGARKHDHPQSFSYHEPWWEAYHTQADYFARLSLALSSGEEVNNILVIEPTTTAWMYQVDPASAGKLQEIGKSFFDLVLGLSKAQVEYDLGSEDIIARHGKAVGNKFVVGRREYTTVVIPQHTETLNARTMEILEEYVKAGGVVICIGEPPALVDGRPSGKIAAISRGKGWYTLKSEDRIDKERLAESCGHVMLKVFNSSRGTVFHHSRRLADGDLVFLVNTSIDADAAVFALSMHCKSVEQWDPETGETKPFPLPEFINTSPKASIWGGAKPDALPAMPGGAGPHGAAAAFSLPPCGSLLLFFSDNGTRLISTARQPSPQPIAPLSPPAIRRIEPNVLTLDYVDISAGGKTEKNLYTYLASQFAFKQNGMDRNPWDSAVQFRDEIIGHKFPAQSGFEATYRFMIEGQPPQPLTLVVERPDLYAIACNGQAVTATPDQWWLDKSFGKIDISAAARTGENAVTLKAAPMTLYHEVEAAYILGDFTLKAGRSGFTIGANKPLALGPWNAQGLPMYAAGAGYAEKFDLPKPDGRYRVRLGKWYGSVAKVLVNGQPAGYISHQPWDCDVTQSIKPGVNTIEVVVIGTLKNTLGPHHAGKTLGNAFPSMFQKGPPHGPPPGDEYDTVGYGLFEPFLLERVAGQ